VQTRCCASDSDNSSHEAQSSGSNRPDPIDEEWKVGIFSA
jgi:hypothetical protein